MKKTESKAQPDGNIDKEQVGTEKEIPTSAPDGKIEEQIPQSELGSAEGTEGGTTTEPETPGGKDVVIKITAEEKESFSSKISYLLTLIGNAVGFGNIWRFPYLLIGNGGITFLVPYCFMLAVLGIPMFFLELAIGQRLHKSTLKAWNCISHYLAGVGVMTGLISAIVGYYYNTLVGWCFRYFFSVFQENLPWKSCATAEEECSKIKPGMPSWVSNSNLTHCVECKKVSPSTHYWYNNVLHISEGIDDPGKFSWALWLCILVAWLVAWGILFKGIRSTGKIVYFTALFPYVVLVIFLIRGLTLPDMEYGYILALTPKWEKLADVKVWFQAGTQIFFSLSLGFGILLSFSALNPANNNCYKDALLVSIINCSTSLFAAIVLYPILGFKGSEDYKICIEEKSKSSTYCLIPVSLNGTKVNCTIDEKNVMFYQNFYNSSSDKLLLSTVLCDRMKSIEGAGGGTGLVFITFTEAMNQFPLPQFWAFLFFLMLLSLGVGSAFTNVEATSIIIHEYNPFNLNIKKWKITTGVSITLATFSILFGFGWGEYLLTFLDEFAANWTLLMSAFFECIGISWIYGLKQFSYDIQLMTGKPPNKYLLICWRFLTPAVMLTLFVLSIWQYTDPKTSLKYAVWSHEEGARVVKPWPAYVIAIGFTLTFIVICPIPIFAILAYFKIYPLKEEAPEPFPEEELRTERHITEEDDTKPESSLDRALFWGSSHQLYHRRSSTISAMAMAAAIKAGIDLENTKVPLGTEPGSTSVGDSTVVTSDVDASSEESPSSV